MLKKVALNTLKLAKFNPASRQADITSLCKSIERVGLLYPLLVTEKNEIVDGHRRYAAIKKLGWTDVPILVATGSSQAEMFAEVNGASRPLRGNETLQVYLEEPLALGAKARNRIGEMEEIIGRTMVEKMAKGGFSLGTWYVVKAICRAADSDEERQMLSILRWLMKYRCARNAQRALTNGTPPSKILAAVKNDKPIRVSYIAG